MMEQSIDEEQLPTTIGKANCLNWAETPPRGSSCSEKGTPPISGSKPSVMYVEARHPHDQDNLVDSLFQKTTPSEDYRTIAPESLLLDLKLHLDKTMAELKDQNKRDFERILMVMQQESAKRTALDQRLHSNLLLHNETMVAMELKLLRLEDKVDRREAAQRQQQRVATPRSNAPIFTIDEGSRERETPANMAVISSGASLASGVTAGSFVGDGDESEKQSGADDVESQQSTPTLGSRVPNPIAGGHLESILLNPMLGEANTTAHSIRATRGDTDGNSSLGTTITQSTLASNLITGGNLESILLNPMLGEADTTAPSTRATRGDTDGNSSLGTTITQSTLASNLITGGNLESILLNPMLGEADTMAQSTRATRGDTDGNSSIGTTITQSTLNSAFLTSVTRGDSIIRGRYFDRRTSSALTEDLTNTSSEAERRPRSRSNSPLTVQSYTNRTVTSEASGASRSTALMSSVAVAAPRTRRALRGETAPDSRPLANRVVSFTRDILQNQQHVENENCDSITMPDELDNLSEVADTIAPSARAWREEYEVRLDALQKRMPTE